jgi:hypothetical protein
MSGQGDLKLSDLRNVGKAALKDFEVLGIVSVPQLAEAEPRELYDRLCALTQARHDPCVEDVFAAAVHQARTGEALDWWVFSRQRRQGAKGT